LVNRMAHRCLVIENAYGIRLWGHGISTGYESKCRSYDRILEGAALWYLGTMRRRRNARILCNPAHAVRGPKHMVKKGNTPVRTQWAKPTAGFNRRMRKTVCLEQRRRKRCQVILVVGEPGLSKSRLVQTLTQRVQAQAGDSSLTAAGESASAPVDQDSPLIEWCCSQHFQNSELHPVSDYLQRFPRDRARSIAYGSLRPIGAAP
jgi:hypothetical protein